MAETTERRSNRSRKPKVHFNDQIAQPLRPSKSSRAPKALAKPTKSTAKPTAKPLKPLATASASTEPSVLDAVEQLCHVLQEGKAEKAANYALGGSWY